MLADQLLLGWDFPWHDQRIPHLMCLLRPETKNVDGILTQERTFDSLYPPQILENRLILMTSKLTTNSVQKNIDKNPTSLLTLTWTSTTVIQHDSRIYGIAGILNRTVRPIFRNLRPNPLLWDRVRREKPNSNVMTIQIDAVEARVAVLHLEHRLRILLAKCMTILSRDRGHPASTMVEKSIYPTENFHKVSRS